MNGWRVWIPLSIFLVLARFSASAQCPCVCTNCRCTDSCELVRLYDSTGGDQWSNTLRNEKKWKTANTPIANWYGISLNSNERVVGIALDSNNLVGSIPNLNISELKSLLLDSNKLTGPIPNFLNLPKLEFLYLQRNTLSGPIPNFELDSLISLYLYRNTLSGRIPDFNRLRQLKYLGLYANQLNGHIPNFIMPKLEHLHLASNFLSDKIPKFNYPNLTLFVLENNQLSGCIPREIKINCPLIDVRVSSILDNQNLATQSWANYWNNGEGVCTIQDINSCRYKDSLQLVTLYDSTNGANWTNQWNFNQPITTWYGIRTNTEGCVTFIDLDGNADFSTAGSTGATGNKLTGQLPTLTFPELLYLFLDNNQLSGTLPLMNTPKIKNLNISYNPQLKGTIPTAWNFPDLEYLALCCNGLDGVLSTLSFPKLLGLYVQNNKLNGVLPVLNLPLIRELDFGENRFSNCFPVSYRVLCPIAFHNFDNTGLCQDATSCRYRDSLALITFFDSTNGPNWTIRDRIIDGERKVSPWNFRLPLDNWHGVYLNNFGCVHQMNLFDNNVGGTLPSGIDSLSNLTLLLLSKNKIGGKIPERLGNMTKITHLDFSFNQLTDTIPQSFGNLRDLELCYLGANNALTGKIPSSFGNFTKIKELMFNECDLFGTIPSELGNLVNVQKLLMNNNRLSGTVPTSLGNLKQIKSLQFGNNQLTGAIPTTFRNLSQLVCLGFENNQIDSVPDLSNIVSLDTGCLQAQVNRLTFDDIVPNRRTNTRFAYSYSPQDSIFQTISYTKNVGAPLSINLNIDGAIADNNYKWFKNGIEIPSLFSQKNTLLLRGVLPCDAGIYTCQVTNNRAPQLTLDSRKITLIVNPIVPQTRNKTICAGQKDTLPSGQIVAPTTTTTYRETIKNKTNTCDSAIITTNLTVQSAQTISKVDSFCSGKNYLLPQTNRAVTTAGTYRDTVTSTGCQAIYITTLTYRKEQTGNVNATLCKGQTYTLPDGQIVNTEGSFTSRKSFSTECDSVVTTVLRLLPIPEAFDDKLELNVGDSATINLLLNDKLGGQNGRITLLTLPTEGTAKRLNDSQIRYTAPKILRGVNEQTLKYKVCLIDCPNNCDSATLRIIIDDNSAFTGRIKNGVAPQISGEEYFEIDSIQSFAKAQLFIYNNWNELVFKSAIPYDNRWRGTGQNDAPLPSGVYYYVLRHAAPNRKYLEGKILLLHD
jgi:CHU_C Type IX secretion signal domain